MSELLVLVLFIATLGLPGSICVSAAFLPIQDRGIRGCGESLDHALAAARRLHSYYGKDRGMYSENNYQWTDSNALEDVQNLMLLSGSDAYSETSETSYLARAAFDPGMDWNGWLGKYNDDTQWHVLSLWKMSDYRRKRGGDPRPYLAAAERMYDIISSHWDDECGGGLWWTTEHTYKNAITNEQFLLLSAAGYLRNHNQTYLDNAKNVWQWLRHSGMRNHQGLFNDGLNFTSCHNNGQTTWTYNQGLVASGLGALSAATGDKALLDEAEITLDATIAHLTTNGILRETCDKDTNEGKNCDGDQQIFKGLWTKHLMYYLEFANEPHRAQKYSQFLGAQSAAIHRHATNITSGDIGSVWYTPTQDHYYNPSSGGYNGGSLWTDANTFEDLHNLMLASGSNDFSSIADGTFLGRAALNPSTNWNNFIGGSFDDAQWFILALWNIADFKGARGLDNSAYLTSAAKIYDIIANQWDDHCGGGVWWSSARTYKNAITNELFLLTSASGFLRNRQLTNYLDNAKRVWNWLKNSGMRNADGLVNDGIDFNTCANNGQTTWTYNQGVIASGLGALFAATGDRTLLDEAEITLDATIRQLSTNNILRESCDNAASGGPVCNQDQQIFKGIWTKHLQYYLDTANDASRTAKYAAFLGSQSSGVLHFGTSASKDVGSVWYAPDQGGSIFTPKTSASGLAAHVAAAKYAPC